MVTFAFGTAAADESSTVPTMLPYTACADALGGSENVRKEKQTQPTAFRIKPPPVRRIHMPSAHYACLSVERQDEWFGWILMGFVGVADAKPLTATRWP
jgi:hypothetical protein